MRIKSIIGLLLAIASAASAAQSLQCVEIGPGARTEVELTPSSDFSNCIFLKGSEALSQVGAISMAVGDFSHKLKMVGMDGAGKVTEVGAHVAAVGGAAGVEVSNAGQRIGLVVIPTSNLTTSKYLSLSYVVNAGYGSVVIRIVDLPTPPPQPTTTPPPTLPPFFEPCVTDKLSGCEAQRAPVGGVTKNRLLNFRTQSQATPVQCSAASTIPPGKHPNFNIDANLAQISKIRQNVDAIRIPSLREQVRAHVMIELFATGAPYDVKQPNHKYHSTQEFGNYFYGMAAARMGYTEGQALKAAAIYQQWQNYDGLPAFLANVAAAAVTGCCDNPDDPPVIKAGFQAGATCETESATTSNGGGGEGQLGETGTGTGWHAGGVVTLPRVCIGQCSSSGSVTVGPTIPVKDTK